MTNLQRSSGGGSNSIRRRLAAASVAVTAAAFFAGAAQAAPGSVVAQANHPSLWIFPVAGARHAVMRWHRPVAGVPIVFLVKRRLNGWEQVYLPKRPNGSTGWVKDRDVTLYRDPYRIDVSLSAHRLDLWRGSRLLFSEAVGVGKASTPTPTGRYFLVELFKQANPGGDYGPYAFGTSAYSDALFSFGGGPGQIGLHGTNEPNLLGGNISHGCIRVRNAAIMRMARLLPLGTPLTVKR